MTATGMGDKNLADDHSVAARFAVYDPLIMPGQQASRTDSALEPFNRDGFRTKAEADPSATMSSPQHPAAGAWLDIRWLEVIFGEGYSADCEDALDIFK